MSTLTTLPTVITPTSRGAATLRQAAAEKADRAPVHGADKLQQACEDFEALLLSTLLNEMRTSLPQGGVLPASSAERLFREMLDGEYAKAIAHAPQAPGIGRVIYEQMSGHASPGHDRSPAARKTAPLDF